ncbi:MAG: cytidylate kinase-like family protein [Bacteroidales bacterium]|nr:cytidylate kinase-like family protein [Bacteroidales bacterium]
MDYVITIGRQFGSGGRELGRLLARKLEIPFYDKELLLKAAEQSGIAPEFFVNNDERMPKLISGLIPFGYGTNPFPWYAGSTSISDDNLYKTQSDLIKAVADQGPCVIVGRSADYVLRDHPCAINVFVHASMDDRVERILRRSDCDDENKARRMAERINKLRANYYNFYTDKRWGDAASYDLTFNSSLLPMSDIADLIIAYVNHRMKKA